jgi:hypothetical protein
MTGIENEYEVEDISIEAAKVEALAMAEDDLYVEDVEDNGDGDYTVTVGFAGFIGSENEYNVVASDEDEAEAEAIEEAKNDLEVTDVIFDESCKKKKLDETFEEYKVVDKNGNEIKEGDEITDFRGDKATFLEITKVPGGASTGKIYVREGD